jgi:hypothetical protein
MRDGRDLVSEPDNRVSELSMMDVVMVALAVGFFAVSIAYVYACEQL